MTLEVARIEIQSLKDTFEEYEPGGTRDQIALKIALSSIRAVSLYHEALGLEPEDILSETGIGKVVCELHELKKFKELGNMDRLRELVEADRAGRCVVLPFQMHKMLFDMSDPIRPEILKDFRISATWDHCGIVFHSQWNIFLENVEKGHIRIIHESVEAIPGEEGDGCEADSV